MKSICLVMVVKDQAPGLGRCLESVKGLISHWVICGAGVNGANEAVRKEVEERFAGVPGSFHEVQAEDSAPRKTQALELARGKADYDLILEPNMTITAGADRQGSSGSGDRCGFQVESCRLEPDAPGQLATCNLQPETSSPESMEVFSITKLEADSYLLRLDGPAECWVERLVSDRHQWRYLGLGREFIFSNSAGSREKLPALTITCHESDSERAARLNAEVELLKEGIERGSNVPRSTFYLAQAYRDLGNLVRAIEHYEERLKMGGWEEELWYSAYQVGCLQQRLGMAWMLVLNRYLEAYQLRPTRAEPLFRIARFYRERGQYRLALLFARAAMDIPVPDDLLFIERSVYESELPLEYAQCCAQLGLQQEAVDAVRPVLRDGSEQGKTLAARWDNAPYQGAEEEGGCSAVLSQTGSGKEPALVYADAAGRLASH